MKNMVITRQQHHAFQAKPVLFVTNVAPDLTTATVHGLLLQCLLLMNGLLDLILKTKPNSTNLSLYLKT